jgi:hypothetical protein
LSNRIDENPGFAKNPDTWPAFLFRRQPAVAPGRATVAKAKIQVSMAKPQWIAKKLRDEIRVITRGVPMRWEPIDKPNPLHTDVTTEAFDRAVSIGTRIGS